jgi:large subunit ribosomal protein L35
MKTNRSAAKRFKVTGTGKVKRQKAYKRHILTSKSRSRKKRLGQATLVSASDMNRIKKLLPGLV